MTERDRDRLKTTFDEVAEVYDHARPIYPEQLFDDLIALAKLQPGANLLEIGCGTGRTTFPLARRGFQITCVELGENLAAVARRNLAPFPEVRVVVAPFETWDPRSQTFDLVYAAASWHWLDPDVRYSKAAALLNTFSGHIALEPDKREYLYRNVRERINARADPLVRRHWLAILNLARKL